MSIFSALMASVSGMNAQANSLSTISDNIANADTVGYKDASTQFEDMLDEFSPSEYDAGGVGTVVNYNIAGQGDEESSSTTTNMMIEGNGFFVVQGASGNTYLTRAGSFAPNAEGDLVNASGYTLMGEPLTGGETSATGFSLDSLEPVQISTTATSPAVKTTAVTLTGNLDSGSTTISPAQTGTDTATDPSYTTMTSVTTYDSLGNSVTYNVYMTNTGGNNWQMDVYNAADATNGGFPYSAGPVSEQTLSFSSTTGALTSPTTTPTFTGTNGQTVSLNVSGLTQLSSSSSLEGSANGNTTGTYEGVSISTDGIVSETFSNGVTTPIYQIPLATVPSVNSLTSMAGDVFETNANSGNIVLGAADSGGFGSINSGELEASTVDLATELTNMVVAQNAYQANSKAFSVGSDMLSDLVNLLK